MYSKMRWAASDNARPDFYTYSAVLKACAETKEIRIGKAVHCHVLRSGLSPSRIVWNSLLNMYSSCSSNGMECFGGHSVLRVFNSMRRRNVVAWNTMIAWFVKIGEFEEAVRHFWLMMKTGVQLSPVSFVNVFPAVSRLGSVDRANLFYGLLLKSGNEFVDDLFTMSSAILMYAELGLVDVARKVFDQSWDRNAEIWNTLIGGYVQNNLPVDALTLFAKALEEEEIVLDEVSFLSALTAASQLQCLDFARQLHAYLLKNSAVVHVTILNALVVMYSRCNLVDMSFEIFSRMYERDSVSWNTMVSALVQNGLDDEGLMLVYEMQNQGFIIDSITITAILSAASNLRKQEIGKQTHAYILRHSIMFEGIESYLIDMYAKCGLVESGRLVFEKCCPYGRDQATWNALIAGYTQNGLSEKAFIMFRQMIEQNIRPTAVTLASILPACQLIGSVALCKQLHGFAIQNWLDQNVFVSSALVDMYSKSGAIAYAEKVFSLSPEKNSVTYTNMILSYGQHGMGEKALSLFHSMENCGFKPDAITFVAVLSACSYAGLVDEGLRIFDSMERKYQICPSHEHYCCITDMLGRVGKVKEAYKFVKDLGEEINNLGLWGSLLAACRIHGEYELGKVIANKLLQQERGNNTAGYCVLLSNMYAEEGNWEDVNKLRKGMRAKGLTKDVGCSWIDVGGYVNCFVSKDQKHPQCDEIYSTLEKLTLNMKDADYRHRLNPEVS